jgi:hypothetical protein
VTGTEIFLALNGSGTLGLLAKTLYESMKSKNGKKEPSINVNVETPKMSSTSGKRICDFHMELNNTLLEVNHTTEDIKKDQMSIKNEMAIISKSNSILHNKLDVIIEHFHLKRF